MIEILFEKYLHKKMKEKYHPDGTYISALLSKEDSDKIYNWAKDHGITNLDSSNDYHATITYSRKGIPDVKEYSFELPITAKLSKWKIFNTQSGGSCLVIGLESDQLTKYHNDIKDLYGATHDFQSFQPHITICYEYNKKEVPDDFPNFNVTFNKVKIEPLNPAFTPKKAK